MKTVEILKVFFGTRADGKHEIRTISPVSLKPSDGEAGGFFQIQNDLFVAQPNTIGTIASILGESIVPIVAQVPGESTLRCLGTGFFISCTGLLITAAHVVTDPIERRYGSARELDDETWFLGDLKLGVMLPLNPILGRLPGGKGYIYRDIEWAAFLGSREMSPFLIQGSDLKLTSDTAVCQVSPIGEGALFQPLPIIQPGLKGLGIAVGRGATAIGYGAMEDVELRQEGDRVMSGDFRFDLHVSQGVVLERFPDNSDNPQVSTPGACFSASMRFPPGMSGSPIFDDERLYVHGVVSKGMDLEEGEEPLGYGAMLSYSLGIPLRTFEGKSLLNLLKAGEHGMPILHIAGA